MIAAKNAALTATELSKELAPDHKYVFWHGVQLYENDACLTKVVSRFLGDGLEMGEGIIVVATAVHHHAFEEQLSSQCLDVPAARARGQYVLLDAGEMLAKFLVEGWPDPVRFHDMFGRVIRRVTNGKYSRVRVFVEMVSLLWEAEQQAAAIRIEELWNDLLTTHACYLLCAYPRASFYDEVQTQAFLNVCSHHSHVLPVESYARQVPAETLATGSGEAAR